MEDISITAADLYVCQDGARCECTLPHLIIPHGKGEKKDSSRNSQQLHLTTSLLLIYQSRYRLLSIYIVTLLLNATERS